MEGFHMANDQKTLLNDEILHFLYKNASFQTLEESAQQQFIAKFKEDENFVEILEISMSLQEMIQEVEATMPKMQDKDFLLTQQLQKQYVKEHTVVEGNVYFVPFQEVEDLFSPMVVALQQSESMMEFEAFCKGTILPLFHLCASQKRDLLIVPFSKMVQQPIAFKNGVITLPMFERFINAGGTSDAELVPAIEQALAIFEADSIGNDRDLMIITDNQYTDFQALMQADFEGKLNELDIDVSVIAMSEVDFEVQPIPFAHKVFFANE